MPIILWGGVEGGGEPRELEIIGVGLHVWLRACLGLLGEA